MKDSYTVDDAAAMTGLNPRTVRSYIASGVLAGEKSEGTWRFTPEQFASFLSDDTVRRSVRAKANAVLYDFLLMEKKPSPAACAILDVPVECGDEQVREALLKRVNDLGLRCAYRYEQTNKTARLIVEGDPQSVGRLLSEW